MSTLAVQNMKKVVNKKQKQQAREKQTRSGSRDAGVLRQKRSWVTTTVEQDIRIPVVTKLTKVHIITIIYFKLHKFVYVMVEM